MGTERSPIRSIDPFVVTKEHRRFSEFATAVCLHRYIGLCSRSAGAGETLSARRLTPWDAAEPLLSTWKTRNASRAPVQEALAQARAVFYTPTVAGTPRKVRADLSELVRRVDGRIDLKLHPGRLMPRTRWPPNIELLAIDGAERLTAQSLDHIRDVFDRTGIGVILIGMPGIETQLERYHQSYSEIGFAHHYRSLKGDELTFVLTCHWRRLGPDEADFTDHRAIAATGRITGGNSRLLHRLSVHIERIMPIDGLTAVTEDVVDVARSSLVIGAGWRSSSQPVVT